MAAKKKPKTSASRRTNRRGKKPVTKKKKAAKKKPTAKRATPSAGSRKATKKNTRKKATKKSARPKKGATKKAPRRKRTQAASGRKKAKRSSRAASRGRKKDDTVLMDMLLGSPARARILRLLFREPGVSLAHKDVAQATGVSLPKVRREAKLLSEIGIITNKSSGGKTRMKVATTFPFIEELKHMVVASFPIGRETLVKMLKPAGSLRLVIAAGTLMNDPKARVDLLVVADRYSEKGLERAVKKVEQAAAAELRWAGMPTKEFQYRWKMFDRFVRDVVNGPHEKVVDRVKT